MKQHRIFILIAIFAAALLNGAEIQKNSFAVVFDAGLTVDDAMTASKKGKLPGTPQTFVMPEIKTFNLKNLRPDYTPIKDAALLSFVINADEAEEIVLGVGVDYWHTLFQNGKQIGTTEPRGGGARMENGFFSRQYKVKLKEGENFFVMHTRPGTASWDVSISNLSSAVACGPYAFQIDRDSAVVALEYRFPVSVWLRCWEAGKSKEKMVFRNSVHGRLERKTLHRFELKNLKPDTVYQYEILPAGGVLLTPAPTGSFKTFPASGTKHVMVAISDTQVENDASRPNLIRKFVKHGVFKDADVLVSVGDVANGFNNFNRMYFDFFLQAFRDEEVTAAYLPVRGNHEMRGHDTDRYQKWFGAPYYAVRYGDVLYIVLDAGEDKNLRKNLAEVSRTDTVDYFEEQRLWMEELVKTDKFQSAKVRIVFCHAAPGRFFVGRYMTKNIEHIIGSLIGEKTAGKIDLWISGHTHSPYRYDPVTRDITGAACRWVEDNHFEQDDLRKLPFPVYVNDGPGGSGEHYSVLRVEVNGSTLNVTCIGYSGNVLDSIVIRPGRPFTVKKTSFLKYKIKEEDKKGK